MFWAKARKPTIWEGSIGGMTAGIDYSEAALDGWRLRATCVSQQMQSARPIAVGRAPTPTAGSILGTFTVRRHFDQLGIELAEDLHKIHLSGHDLVNVLVDSRHFIEASRDELHAAIL